MSRLRRLKKTKNSIKATVFSLALTLGIGLMQSNATYALFKDEEKINNNLSITMGKVENEIEEGLSVDNLGIDDKPYTKRFTIKNNSTFDQKIKLIFFTPELNYFKEYINYEINIETSDGHKVFIDKSSGELFNEDKKTRLVLKPKVNLICTSTISIKKKEAILSDKIIKFDLKVSSRQVSYVNGVVDYNKIGFTDECIQKNLVKICEIEQPNEEVVVPNEQDKVQPPNEEVVESNKQDEGESPKEEVVVPNEQGVIELSKVKEMVEKDQTDIIAQKK